MISPKILKTLRLLLGLAIWCGLILIVGRILTEHRGENAGTLSQLGDYLRGEPASAIVQLERRYFVELGDAVFLEGEKTVQIGEVDALLDDKDDERPEFFGLSSRVRLELYDPDRVQLFEDATARLVLVPDAFVWVVETLLTEENVPRIAAEWNDTMLRHRDDIFRLVTPIVRDLLHDVEATVEENLDGFVARHQGELRLLARELQGDLDDRGMAQLFQREVWPLAEARFRPVANRIGKEVWEKVPFWSFSWRIAYQTLPLTANDHFARAWKEFVNKEIRPIIMAHLDEIIAVTRQVGRDAIANKKIQEQMRSTFIRLTSHPRFHALAQVFIQEVFLDNPNFHDRLLTRLKSPEVERVLTAASAHVEPSLRRIADIVFGTREEGITKEFARVLRAQILQKDRRRFVIHPGTEGRPHLPEGQALPTRVEWERAK